MRRESIHWWRCGTNKLIADCLFFELEAISCRRRQSIASSHTIAARSAHRVLRGSTAEENRAGRFDQRATQQFVAGESVSLEIAPGQIVKTSGYNGLVPGPVLRMKEGVKTSVEVRNDSEFSELVHWHGLMVPDDVDGAAEEGTKPIPAHGTALHVYSQALRHALVSHP